MKSRLPVLAVIAAILCVTLFGGRPTAAQSSTPSFVHSLLRVYTSQGKFAVYLNGKKIGDYKGLVKVDVSPYVKAGENTMKIVWPKKTWGNVKIAHAKQKNDFKDISKIEIMYAEGKEAGSETVSFLLPKIP